MDEITITAWSRWGAEGWRWTERRQDGDETDWRTDGDGEGLFWLHIEGGGAVWRQTHGSLQFQLPNDLRRAQAQVASAIRKRAPGTSVNIGS